MKDLKWVIDDFHKKQVSNYNSTHKEFSGILSDKDTFFIPFMAALGKSRNTEEIDIEKMKDKLIGLFDLKLDDPLNLSIFREITDSYKSGIGMKKRRLVFQAFYMFFRGMSGNKIDWRLAADFS
jgi:hypothetical protein